MGGPRGTPREGTTLPRSIWEGTCPAAPALHESGSQLPKQFAPFPCRRLGSPVPAKAEVWMGREVRAEAEASSRHVTSGREPQVPAWPMRAGTRGLRAACSLDSKHTWGCMQPHPPPPAPIHTHPSPVGDWGVGVRQPLAPSAHILQPSSKE